MRTRAFAPGIVLNPPLSRGAAPCPASPLPGHDSRAWHGPGGQPGTAPLAVCLPRGAPGPEGRLPPAAAASLPGKGTGAVPDAPRAPRPAWLPRLQQPHWARLPGNTRCQRHGPQELSHPSAPPGRGWRREHGSQEGRRWEGRPRRGGEERPGFTLMTSPPSTFISFWRLPARRLGLARHFSSPSRLTGGGRGQSPWGVGEGDSHHGFTRCQPRSLLNPQAPPPPHHCLGHPLGEAPSRRDAVPLDAGPTLGERRWAPAVPGSHRSVVWLCGQAPSSAAGDKPRPPTAGVSPGAAASPRSTNLSGRGPQAGGPWVAILPDSCPPPAGPHQGLGPVEGPCTPCGFPVPPPGHLPHAPGHAAHLWQPLCSSCGPCQSDTHGTTRQPTGTAPGERPWHRRADDQCGAAGGSRDPQASEPPRASRLQHHEPKLCCGKGTGWRAMAPRPEPWRPQDPSAQQR